MQSNKKRNSSLSRRFKVWYRLSSYQWKVDRFAFWPLMIILIIIAVAYFGGYLTDAQDFAMQSWFFGGCALGIGIIGVTVGYKRPNRKNLWGLADLVWLCMTLFTLGKVLVPLESYFAAGELASAESRVLTAQKALIAHAYAGTDRACAALAADLPACEKWRTFERAVLLPQLSSVDLGTVVGPAVGGLRLAGLYEADPEIDLQLKELMKALEQRHALKSKHERIDFSVPYLYIVILSLALGFRAARTGGELARNRIEAQKKATDKEKAANQKKKEGEEAKRAVQADQRKKRAALRTARSRLRPSVRPLGHALRSRADSPSSRPAAPCAPAPTPD